MPIFEYICTQCGSAFDVLVREGVIPACPSCKSRSLEKQFSVFAAHTGSTAKTPSCAGACPGFTQGSCGSGRCGTD